MEDIPGHGPDIVSMPFCTTSVGARTHLEDQQRNMQEDWAIEARPHHRHFLWTTGEQEEWIDMYDAPSCSSAGRYTHF